jgi:hypothetical protein
MSCPNYNLPLYKDLVNKYNENTMLAVHALLESPEFIAWKGDNELPTYISKLNVVKNNKGEYLKLDKFIQNMASSYSLTPKTPSYIVNVNSLLKDRLKTLKKSHNKLVKEAMLNREKLSAEDLKKKLAILNLQYQEQIELLNNNIELLENEPNIENIHKIAFEQLNYIQKAFETPGLKPAELNLYKTYLDVWSIINTSDIFDPLILDNLNDTNIELLGQIANKSKILLNKWAIIAKDTLLQDIKNKTTFKNLSEITMEKVIDSFIDEGSVAAYGQDLSSVSNFLAQHIDKYLKDARNITAEEFRQLMENFTRVLKGVNKKGDFIKNKQGDIIGRFTESFYLSQQVAKAQLTKQLEKAKAIKGKDVVNTKKRFAIIDKAYADYSIWINSNKYIIDPRKVNDKSLYDDLVKEFGKTEAEDLIKKAKEAYAKWDEDFENFKDHIELQGLNDAQKNQAIERYDLENNPEYYIQRYIDGITKTAATDSNTQNLGWKYIINVPRKYEAKVTHEWVTKDGNDFYQRRNIIERTNKETGYYDEKYAELHRTLSEDETKELIELVKTKKTSPRLLELEKKAPQLAFYLFWKYNMKDLFSNIPSIYKEDINANMMPQMKKDLLSTLTSGDFKGGWQAFTTEMLNLITNTDYDTVSSERDVITGEIKPSIPVKFLTKIEENREEDLETIFRNFALMSLNYKNKAAVQDIVELGAKILYEAKIIQTNGSIPIKIPNGILTIQNGEANIKKAVKYQIEANLYGKTKKEENWGRTDIHLSGTNLNKKFEKSEKFTDADLKGLTSKKKQRALEIQTRGHKLLDELTDTSLSPEQKAKKIKEFEDLNSELKTLTGGKLDIVKFLDSNIRFTALKVLGYNPVSAVVNAGFGVMGNFIHAAGGQEFTVKQAFKAWGLLTSSLKIGISFNEKLRTKITKLMDLYGIESNDLYGKSDSKWSWLSPYELMRKGDYLIKGQTMIATMMNTKVGDKSLWEMYDDNGNFIEENVQWAKGDLNTEMEEFKKFQNKVQAISQIIHGDFNNPKMLNATIVGRLISQFRLSWIAEGISDRFREEYYNERLGRNVKGRWRTYSSIAKQEGVLKLIGRVLKTFTLQKSGVEGLSEIDQANLKKNIAELYIVVGLTMIIMMLKGADDDDDKNEYTFLINQLQRLNNDLYFYADPNTAESITKTLIPSLKTFTDLKKALNASYNYITKDGKRYDEEYLFMNWARTVPGINQIPKIKYQSSKVLSTS